MCIRDRCVCVCVTNTLIFQIIFEISPLQAILLTLCVCVCVCVRACVRACVLACVLACVRACVLCVEFGLVLYFVMGYVLQFGEIAHKRVHYYCCYYLRSQNQSQISVGLLCANPLHVYGRYSRHHSLDDAACDRLGMTKISHLRN